MSTAQRNKEILHKEIGNIFSYYKKHFREIRPQEIYKWKAVKWYKEHWNINAPDFPAMLEESFKKTGNLLMSRMYYPYGMIVEYAKENPEEARDAFKNLYDESKPLVQRYKEFQEEVDRYCRPLNKKTYQDQHTISVYLSFEYPEKYFIYKASLYTTLRDRIKLVEDKTLPYGLERNLKNYQSLCELILEETKEDTELLKISEESLDTDCYLDKEYHLLAHDILYCGARYMDESDWLGTVNAQSEYWPSITEYNPGITKEKWIEILGNKQITLPENIEMLRQMIEQGGESTCAHLAEIYGKSYAYYNKLGSSFSERVRRSVGCPKYFDTKFENLRSYPVAFQGRYLVENGNRHYSWKLRDELKEAFMEINNTISEDRMKRTDIPLNTILYGPPGTGKTYNTVVYAVAIIENKPLSVVEQEDYAQVRSRYQQYKKDERIEFTTFHQSYGYEEFIEGIKPVLLQEGDAPNEMIQYKIDSGIFKKFCERVNQEVNGYTTKIDFRPNANIWKVSLEGTGDNPTRTECLNNGHIRIGWDEYGKDITDETDFSTYGGQKVLNSFISRMQIGDIVLSCYSASTIDAIGIVTGEYEWHPEYSKYKRLRKVNWLAKEIREDILAINSGVSMTLSSVYRMANVALSDIYQILNRYVSNTLTPIKNEKKNYVFIIDEINRGNISKILGELITLIEPNKRTGQPEELKVKLPYSHKEFGVPDNVYIIGTMNTSDRSITGIDTALRRRFAFKEIMPNPEVLSGIEVEGISISKMLECMNKRIDILYDREHTIGHAYFMKLKANPKMSVLADIFKNNIIPLLQEYFYEDYQKIQLVLGDNQKEKQEEKFIINDENDYDGLFGTTEIDNDETFQYKINEAAFNNPKAYEFLSD